MTNLRDGAADPRDCFVRFNPAAGRDGKSKLGPGRGIEVTPFFTMGPSESAHAAGVKIDVLKGAVIIVILTLQRES